MLAASYWSLLAPAIEMAEASGSYGAGGRFAFVPVSVGFILGAVFVYGADKLMPLLVIFQSKYLFLLIIIIYKKVFDSDRFLCIYCDSHNWCTIKQVFKFRCPNTTFCNYIGYLYLDTYAIHASIL